MRKRSSPEEQAKRAVSHRWTADLAAVGWTPVSDFFLDNYATLDPPISTSEAMLVIHLMRHKWDEKAPFPAFKTLARRLGLTDTAVRGHARRLEQKGYLKRVKRIGQPNLFDLKPLFDALEARLQENDTNEAPQPRRRRLRAPTRSEPVES